MRSKLTLEQQTMTLARLLSQRQWTVLESILTSRCNLPILVDDPSLPHAVTSDIVVHFAARFRAPLRILSLLGRRYPESLASPDVTGRYPIHVAAKWGATPEVVAYFVKSNPEAAGVPDATGKTPMHYVGECYLKNFNFDSEYSPDDCMLQVVRLLKNAAPRSVNLEDNEGRNAIEYALDSDACLKVVKTMQRACRDDWRMRSVTGPAAISPTEVLDQPTKSQAGRRRHDDLVKDMDAMALQLQNSFRSSMGRRGGVSFRADGSFKAANERVHVHRSSATEAKTLAARTA